MAKITFFSSLALIIVMAWMIPDARAAQIPAGSTLLLPVLNGSFSANQNGFRVNSPVGSGHIGRNGFGVQTPHGGFNIGGGGGGFGGSGGGGTIAEVLCGVVGWFIGPVGKGIATLGIIVLGIGALMGKVSHGMAITVGVGVATIFGAESIVDELTGGIAGASCGYGGGSGFSIRF